MKVQHYMARPDELDKHAGVVEMFQRIADQAGDRAENVFMALWSFWNFEHALDDVLDSGLMTEAERLTLLRSCADYLRTALLNPSQPDFIVRFKADYLKALELSPITDQALAAQAFDDFTGNLLVNPIFTDNPQGHMALFDMMIWRAIAGDEMAGSLQEKRRVLAPAVRCGDLDWIVHVAYIAGGWDFAREISSLRDYDVPDKKPVEEKPLRVTVAV